MTRLRGILQSHRLIGGLVAAFALAVYVRTLAPTVSFIDAGELTAVACTLGVAHPTGYPLFTLLGHLFARLPIAADEVVRLNLMAAFLCAAGIVVFYSVARFVIGLGSGGDTARAPAMREERWRISGAAAGASLLLAFSSTYWSQAVSVEVYSLHVFLLLIVLGTFLRANFPDPARGGNEVWWILFAFALGLCFTNHMTTILLAPGLLYLYFAAQGSNRASWRRIAVMALPFLGGLSVYLYLPIRASQLPVLNWGNPSTLERFLWHLSGKQYRVWIFSSTEAAGRQFQYFLSAIPREFVYIGLVFGLIGLLVLLRRNRRLFIGLIVMFVTCVLYSINYDIHDIDSYFLLAYITTAILGAVGMDFTARWIARRAGWRHEIGAVLMVLCGLVPLVVHYREVDESGDYLVEDYTKNMFASVEDNALILSYQWDYWVSASLYYQLVKGMRPDVMVVDKELLRRSWYFKELTERYPRLISRSKPEVDAFLAELYKFENELPYDPAVIQARYVAMIASFVSKTIQERPVYVTGEIEPEFTRGFQRVPEGLAFRLYPDAGFHPPEMPQIRYRPFPRRGRLEDLTRRLYSDAFLARGEYLVLAGNRGEAEQAVRTALEFDPTSSRARQWLSSLPK